MESSLLTVRGKSFTDPIKTICEIKKNSKNLFRMTRTDRIVASVNATRPVTPHLIHPFVRANLAGSLDKRIYLIYF